MSSSLDMLSCILLNAASLRKPVRRLLFNRVVFDNYYPVYRRDRSNGRKGGGVCLLARPYLQGVHIETASSAETAAIDILRGSPLAYRVVCVYCSPTGTTSELQQSTQTVVSCDTQSSICIVGDFNLPDINWNTGASPGTIFARETIFNSFRLSNGLFQLVRKSTWPASGNVLDLLLTSQDDSVLDVPVSPGPVLSDHLAVRFKIDRMCGKSA